MGYIPADYYERCYAGFLGKAIGVRHGAPIEGWSYRDIERILGEIDGYPVDYSRFAADDDTNGPMFFLRALIDYGLNATAEEMGKTWLNYAPYEHGFYWWGGYGKSTEHTAYLNLRAGIPAPRSGSVEQNGAAVAEQIGGQIFIDTWGLVAPGNPALAAGYASRAASVSHGGNGIYGGMFVAAAIAKAFTAHSVDEIYNAGLDAVPEDCEIARCANDIRAFYNDHAEKGWRYCFKHIFDNWGYDRYPGNCHIIPNSAIIYMSLLYGEGDFDRTINICNMAGWDTDCNVGNVGTIMGVFVGLDGIDYDKWRKPINDFMASSSVMGSMNIMDIPTCAHTICALGYAIAGETPPDGFTGGAGVYGFDLPGATHGFTAYVKGRDNAETILKQTTQRAFSGDGSLKLTQIRAQRSDETIVSLRTYLRPEDFHDSRYDPSFSPILYPGQTVTARVSGDGAEVSARLFAKDFSSGEVYYGDEVKPLGGDWSALALNIPGGAALIGEVGLSVRPLGGGTVSVYLDDVVFSGAADYAVDFAKERMEVWTGLHREVSQFSFLKGLWCIEDGALIGSCADFGEAYTGGADWRDYAVSADVALLTEGVAGINIRVQGAMRSYAAAFDGKVLKLLKNDCGYRVLAEMPFAEREARLELRAKGNAIELLVNGQAALSYTDADKPYLYGAVGYMVQSGGRMRSKGLTVKPL